MTIVEYAKRNKMEQALIVREHAVYLDQYNDNGKTVFIYYMNGFFIEAVTSLGVIIDMIPYRKYDISKSKLNDMLKRYGGGRLAA